MKKLLFILSILTVACGPSQQEYDTLLKQAEGLEAEIASLKEELEMYKNTPDRLYSDVPGLIKNKDIEGLTAISNKLEKYHPASDECQKAKSALNKLIAENEAKIKAEKEKRMRAVNKLRKEYDDVSGITWYYNPSFVHYNNTNRVSLYIGQDSNNVWLRLKISYEGNSWIFFENAYLSYDGNTREISCSNKETEVGNGGRVWEWIDVPVDEALLSYLKAFTEGKSIKIKLSGKYSNTRAVSNPERRALNDVLLAYDVLTKGE